MINSEITIYSTATCPYCKMLKDYLSERKIAFTEKFVDQDEVAKTEMMKISGGFLGVPFTVINSEKEELSVIGFDKKRINELLNISE